VPPDPNAAEIPDEWVKELAASGALCQVCGGVHLVSMDQLILVTQTNRLTGAELPWCTCPRCPDCGPWKDTASATAERLLRERREKQPR